MRHLTVRGRCFVATGVAGVLCGTQIGESDFVRVGLLAVLVPLLSVLVLRGSQPCLSVRREPSRLQVESGGAVRVELEVDNSGRRTRELLLEEHLPAALGQNRRFVVASLPSGSKTVLSYVATAESRGRHPIGPMRVRLADPLGMVDLEQGLGMTGSILVTPRSDPLPAIDLHGHWSGSGENRSRTPVGGGSPDVSTRSYHLGDDLRRVHWPTSARVGELMVRREDHEPQSRCTLLIDNRRGSHRGCGPSSSMEAAVRATTSILRHLVARGFVVRLVSAEGGRSVPGWHQERRGAGLPEQLERLALMGTTSARHLDADWVDEAQHGGLLLAVLGQLDRADASLLAGLANASDAAFGVVLDVAGWDLRTPTDPSATAALRSGGWKAITLERDGSLAAAWQELGR